MQDDEKNEYKQFMQDVMEVLKEQNSLNVTMAKEILNLTYEIQLLKKGKKND